MESNTTPHRFGSAARLWTLGPLIFVFISLLLLFVVPIIVEGRLQRNRAELEQTAVPGRHLVDRVRVALAREAVNSRNYLLTGDSSHLNGIGQLIAQEEEALAALRPIAERLSPEAAEILREVNEAIAAWHGVRDSIFGQEGRVPARVVPALDARLSAALARAELLTQRIDDAAADERAAIEATSVIWTTAQAVLALVALISAGLVVLSGRRLLRLNDQLRQAVAARDDLLATVTHDLRNPLAAVAMSSGVLEWDLEPEVHSKHVHAIRKAIGSMSRLLDDLLDVNAAETGRLKLERTRTDVQPLLEQAAESWSARASASGIRLERRAEEDLPPIEADPERLGQVFGNLIGNAVRETPPGGKVTIAAEAVRGFIRFSVRDTGPGIDPDHLARIFDRFWTKERAGRNGHGLGLAIARGIVEAHGGRISCESQPGAGACFTFTIPAVDDQPRAASSGAA